MQHQVLLAAVCSTFLLTAACGGPAGDAASGNFCDPLAEIPEQPSAFDVPAYQAWQDDFLSGMRQAVDRVPADVSDEAHEALEFFEVSMADNSTAEQNLDNTRERLDAVRAFDDYVTETCGDGLPGWSS